MSFIHTKELTLYREAKRSFPADLRDSEPDSITWTVYEYSYQDDIDGFSATGLACLRPQTALLFLEWVH